MCIRDRAYASLRDYTNAINCFEKSVADTTNPTPYKSYMGMGNALMKLGKSAEAGVAFREAALDESNPDPTKALLNLGVCFMALNRPADAVASYESALQFDMQPATRNKLQASLGQAYVACGQMEKAVHAFEEAIADKTYYLSDSASVDYQRAVGAVAQGTSEPVSYTHLATTSISGGRPPSCSTSRRSRRPRWTGSRCAARTSSSTASPTPLRSLWASGRTCLLYTSRCV